MSRLAFILISLLVLFTLTFSPSSSSAQPIATSPSSSLYKLRGKLSASRPLYTPASITPLPAEPVDIAPETTITLTDQATVASILPYRTPEEELTQKQAATEDRTLASLVAPEDHTLDSLVSLEAPALPEADDTTAVRLEEAGEDKGQLASILPYHTEEELNTAKAAQLASLLEAGETTWTGEVASVLPYRETNADEVRETAEEEEDSEFGVARIVPFDSESAVNASSEDEQAAAVDEAALVSKVLNESDWAKRSRVRRYRLRRWLTAKKLGEPVIYSD